MPDETVEEEVEVWYGCCPICDYTIWEDDPPQIWDGDYYVTVCSDCAAAQE